MVQCVTRTIASAGAVIPGRGTVPRVIDFLPVHWAAFICLPLGCGS